MEPVLVKPFVYILKLEDDCWYVGITFNLNMRFAQHLDGTGALWTKLHKPIKIKSVIVDGSMDLERKITLKCMSKYGWEKVRGASWCKIELKNNPLNIIHINNNVRTDGV